MNPAAELHWDQIANWSQFFDYLHGGSAALGTVISAVAAILAYLLKSLAEALSRRLTRSHRRSEMLKAVDADIRRTVRNYEDVYSTRYKSNVEAQFQAARTAGTDHVPFSSTVEDAISPLITEQLPGLSGRMIELAVDYFAIGNLISQMIIDMRIDAYKQMSLDRKQAVALYIYDLAQQRLQVARSLSAAIAQRAARIRLAYLFALLAAGLGAICAAIVLYDLR